MKNITTYFKDTESFVEINEAKEELFVPKSAHEFIKWADGVKYAWDTEGHLTKEEVQALFDLSNKFSHSDRLKRLPFVCNYRGYNTFVFRRWVKTAYDLKKIKFKYLDPNVKARGSQYAGFHDTSLGDDGSFHIRAKRGLDNEKQTLQNIIKYCLIMASGGSFDKNADIKYLTPLYADGEFDILIEAIKEMLNKEDAAVVDDVDVLANKLTDIIYLSGSGNTYRNKNQELFDNEFNLRSDNVNDVLKDSAKIIADIDIKTTNRTAYISCKLDLSQLSGVNINNVFNGPEFINDLTSDITRTSQFTSTAFINFCNAFNLNPLYIYKHIKSKTSILKGDKQAFADKGSLNDIASLIIKLIGGGYWYVTPTKCVKVPDTYDGKCEYILKDFSMSESAKTFNFIGELKRGAKTIQCDLQFRTDGVDKFAYRLFPKIKIEDLISLLS